MATAVLIVTLLTVAASLASWLFGQWLAGRARVSGAALALAGGGTVLLIGSVALVLVAASTGWVHFIPVQDFSLLEPAPMPARSTETAALERAADPLPQPEQAQPEPSQPEQLAQARADLVEIAEPNPTFETEPVVEPVPRARFNEPKEGMLAAAERYLAQNEYAEAIGVARQYLVDQPADPEMRSMLARSLFEAEHPGSASLIPAVVVAEWPATDCVASMRSEESARWILDNGCGRVVAVLFASCQLSETACFTNALVSQGWSYEPAGILMTAANDKPVPLRLGNEGPLVAPIFTIRDPAGTRRQIRYLACEVTTPAVLQLLHTSGGDERQLTAELRADACYSQVLDWSRSGQRLGSSPDALLRQGID